jgi:hypothetical protein
MGKLLAVTSPKARIFTGLIEAPRQAFVSTFLGRVLPDFGRRKDVLTSIKWFVPRVSWRTKVTRL